MNSLGVPQAVTDRDRAQISLSYHCVCLSDVYWVRIVGEAVTFAELNLYDNPLNEATILLPLQGKHLTVTNEELAPDLSAKGCFPKAWICTGTEFRLLKDGGEEVVRREVLASKISQCFDVPQSAYEEYIYDGEVVTQSIIVTSKQYSMIFKMAYDVYAINNNLDTIEECIRLDPIVYYGMNILDYLVGNTDRNPENWGFLNVTNQPVSLYPLMDFNMCFQTYDKLDGANCRTVGSRRLTQREAAIEAVQAIGLRQIRDIDMTIFDGMDREREMFKLRLAEREKYARPNQNFILPVLEEYFCWVNTLNPEKGSKLADAVTYAKNQKAALTAFVEHGDVLISNNLAENAIRPFAVGRKTGFSAIP